MPIIIAAYHPQSTLLVVINMNKTLVVILTLCSFQINAASNKFEEIKFASGDIKLSGTIVSPKIDDIHSAVVFVHGSGKQTRSLYWAERFASNGIAALVYDKRGVGLSGGEYETLVKRISIY